MARTRALPIYRHYRVLFEVGSFAGVCDGELLARFVNRQDEAAELAFRGARRAARSSKVLRIRLAVIGNEHDAEDAFQATFLVLATKASNLRTREPLGPGSLQGPPDRQGCQARALAREARERRAAGDRN